MKHIVYSDGGYAPVPLQDIPFTGDFILKERNTERVLWDSRKDGYDPDGTYIVDWIELSRYDSGADGAVFVFTVYHPHDMN